MKEKILMCGVIFCSLAMQFGNKLYANFFPCCNKSQFYVDVEALYWKTMHCPIFVARRFVSGTNIGDRPREEFYLTGEYDPGVRVRVGTRFCKLLFDLSYLYFCSEEKTSADIGDFDAMIMAGSPLFGVGQILAAKSSAKFRYQNVDGRFGSCFCLTDCFNTLLYGNVRWVKIDFKNVTLGIPSSGVDTFFDNFRQDDTFKGGGFGLGAETGYNLCGGLSLRGDVGVMGIIGESKLKNFSSRFQDGTDVRSNVLSKSNSWCHILPALDFKLGLNYEFCLCSCPIETEVGYELDYYFNVMVYASNTEVGTGRAEIPPFSCQNVGFGGPYFKLSIMF